MRAVLICVMLALAVPVVASAQPADGQEEPVRGRSGFWTNPNPAVGGAYRWRLLYVGIGLATLTGFGMLKLVKRANADRARRAQQP